MNRTLFTTTIILIFLLRTASLLCQVSEDHAESQRHLIAMVGKQTEYVGIIEKGTKDSIWFREGETLHAFHISEVGTISEYDYDGIYRRYERNSERYVLAPTALSLKKGEAYYQNLLVIGSAIGVGVTDHFSITMGTFAPSVFSYTFTGYLAPKYSIELSDRVNLGIGAIGGMMVYIEDYYVEGLMLVPFVNTTIGSVDNNFTIGLGYGAEDKEQQNKIFGGMFAFKVRFGEKFNLVSESTFAKVERPYLISESDNWYFGSHVIRRSVRKNSFDFGVVLISEFTNSVPIPYFGYTRSF